MLGYKSGGATSAPPPEEEEEETYPVPQGAASGGYGGYNYLPDYDMAYGPDYSAEPDYDPAAYEVAPAPYEGAASGGYGEHNWLSPEQYLSVVEPDPTGFKSFVPPYQPYGTDEYRYGENRGPASGGYGGRNRTNPVRLRPDTAMGGNQPPAGPASMGYGGRQPDATLHTTPGVWSGDAANVDAENRFRTQTDRARRGQRPALIPITGDPDQFGEDFFHQVADWAPAVFDPEQAVAGLARPWLTRLYAAGMDPKQVRDNMRRWGNDPYVPDPLSGANAMAYWSIFMPRPDEHPVTGETPPDPFEESIGIQSLEIPKWAREGAKNMARRLHDAEINPWAGPYWLYGHPRDRGEPVPQLDELGQAQNYRSRPGVYGLYGGGYAADPEPLPPTPTHRYRR